jgi:multidrug efflux pump subunit AcrB
MSKTPSPPAEDRSGPLAWFAGNHVAANLLMLFVLAMGLLSLSSIVVETFPEFSIDRITVSVVHRGATPVETEEGVVVKVEEAVASIEGIKRISGTAAEGAGAVTIELEDDADGVWVLNEVKAAVDRINTFPEETEKPVVSEVISRREVVSVVVHGDTSRKTLAALAERLRDDLTAAPGISQAEIQGLPSYEISIEVAEEKLRRHGLTFQSVADAVRGASLDLPGGSVKTHGGEILLRTQGQKYHGDEFAEIVVLTRGDGTRVRLADVATVIDGFEDADVTSRFDGRPAAVVQIFRTGDEGALEIASTVYEYVDRIRETLPAGVAIDTWADRSIVLRQRISLLLENAAIGLVLVFLSLAFFLDLRLAFWTTMGIPISFLGGLWLLPYFDVSINMISLFAFIVSLGIVVDDAIIVGENIFSYLQKGFRPIDAAIRGVREMAVPVSFAILTTVAAFLPLVFVEGLMGKVMRNIPLVVIAVLIISLLEGLLILPAHLSGDGRAPRFLRPLTALLRPLLTVHKAIRRRATGGLEKLIHGPYARLLEKTLEWRYLTAAVAIATLFLTAGVVAAGWLKFTLMPAIDADSMTALLEMPQGTPVEQTERIAARIEQAAVELGRQYDQPVVVHLNTILGEQPATGGKGPIALGSLTGSGGHLAQVTVELLKGEERNVASAELMNRWREQVGEVPGATSLSYQASFFTAGDPVSVQLAHQDFETLLVAVERLKSVLDEYPGVTDIADSFVPGKRELKLDLTEEGRALGLTRRELARQVRQGFYGEEAQRIQRGRNDIRVMVRYPEAQRTSRGDIEAMRIRLRDGTETSFPTVATVAEGRGYATLKRVDRRRVVTVTADVDDDVANATEINATLMSAVLPRLIADFPGLMFDFEGEERAKQESLASLRTNFVIALLAIFALLAIPFRSYSQPLIIMSVIPFGFVGAVAGHLVMGLELSLLSFFGMVALTGVVVNDSLILVDLVNRERRRGVPLDVALRTAPLRRFRPIILTTLTTFFGLTPMLLETSLQAQFLIPMAVSLGFGVVFATVITLILVPVTYRILEDAHQLFESSSVEAVEEEEGVGVVEEGLPSPA